MKPTNPNQELKKIYRFFKNQVAKYILLVVDDQRIFNYLIIQAQVELKKHGKEILHLKLKEDNFSIFHQVEEFLAGNRCNGLIVSNVNTLIYRNEKETIEKLNRSRDAFEKFRIPVIFVLNNDNLKKIINGAADFYQLRDLPDFHFEGTIIEDREILDINIPQVESYADSDLKAELLEEQLRIIDKKKKIDKHSLNNIVMPLLNIYITNSDYNNMKTLFDRYVKGKENLTTHKMLIGDYYANIYAFDKALSYYKEELEKLKQSENSPNLSRCYHQIGMIYQDRGDYDNALKQYIISLKLLEKTGDLEGVSSVLNNIGNIYQERGQYDKALKYYEDTLRIKEEIGDIAGTSKSYHNLGVIFKSRGDIDKALDYYKKSLIIKEKIGDIKGISSSLHQMGRIFQDKNDFEQALKIYKKTIILFEKIGDAKGISSSLHNIGMIYHHKGDIDQALKFYKKSLKIKEKLVDNLGLANSFAQLGKLYFDKKEFSISLKYTIQAFLLFANMGAVQTIKVTHDIRKIKKQISKNEFEAILDELNLSSEVFEKVEKRVDVLKGDMKKYNVKGSKIR